MINITGHVDNVFIQQDRELKPDYRDKPIYFGVNNPVRIIER